MARLRFTLEEARDLAELLADNLIAGMSWGTTVRKIGATPASPDRQGKSSKHPTAWTVIYQIKVPEGSTIDGGEVFVEIDLESKSATLRDSF